MSDNQKKVTIYSTPTCRFCHMAKEFFNANNIEFTDYNVKADPAKGQEMVKLTGQMGVPVIIIEGAEPIVGFNEPAIRAALGI